MTQIQQDKSASPFTLFEADAPILVSVPHAGTVIPADIAATMTPAALVRADTDWHIPEVYNFLQGLGITTLSATHSRLVVDLNRPADDQNLYPGQDTTSLVPTDTFAKEAVYLNDAPDKHEIDRRRELYWKPYHAALSAQLERLLSMHKTVVLWDAHSIASHVPRFFDGRLTDLNFGTSNGEASDSGLAEIVMHTAAKYPAFSSVLNGRFKGGFITRHYGQPQNGVHAIQLEMSQITYMIERPPFSLAQEPCAALRPCLQAMVSAALEWAHTR